jgi:hypothetical protein
MMNEACPGDGNHPGINGIKAKDRPENIGSASPNKTSKPYDFSSFHAE